MKLNFSFRKTLGILISAAFILIFALYCSARVGYFLLSALILAPVFSILTALYAKSRLIITSDISHTALSKGNTCTLTVTLNNNGFLPCPPVSVEISDNPHLCSNRKKIEIYTLPRHERSVRAVFIARLSGGSYIGIENAVFSDWFGICSFSICKAPQLYKVGVIPEIIRRNADTDLLESVSDTYSSDKNDDTIDEASFAFNGYAGYDYRQYEPGDPIKRINSKVSAKMGELMVRLDEKQAASFVNIIIDPYMEKEDALLAENILETALGMAFSLILLDFSVRLYYADNDDLPKTGSGQEDDLNKIPEWHDITISTGDTLPYAAQNLSGLIFSGDIPSSVFEDLLSLTDKTCIMISSGSRNEIKHMNVYNCSTGEWRHI